MAEIGHAYWNRIDTARTTSSATFVQLGGGADGIPSTDLAANTKYLLLASYGVGGNSTSVNEFEFQMSGEGATLSYSHSQIESRRVSAGQHYFYLTEITTDASPSDCYMEFKGNGTDTARVEYQWQLMLAVDDLAAGDYVYDEDTTALTSLDNSAWTDGASVTIGNGVSDYLVAIFAHCGVDSTTAGIRVRLDVNGTAFDHIELEGEDTVEEFCIGAFLCVANPGTNVTAKVQVQTDSATAGLMDIDCTRIMAIRLNAFEDNFFERDATDVPITAIDTDFTVAATTHTTATAASRDWVIGGYTVQDVGEHTKMTRRRIDEATLGTLIGGHSADRLCQHGATDQVPSSWAVVQAGIANATSLDLSLVIQEDTDVTPNPSNIDGNLFGFTLELAAAANNVSNLASATLTLTANAPTAVATEHHVSNLPAATLTLTANAPTATATDHNTAELATATLTLTANAPQAVTTEHRVSELPAATLTLTANAPQAVTTEHHSAELPSASLTLTANAPTVTASEHHSAELPAATLTLTAAAPQAVATEHNVAELPAATLTLTTFAPEAFTTAGEASALPAATLTLTAFAPTAVVTEHNVAELPAAALTLTAYAPIVSVSDTGPPPPSGSSDKSKFSEAVMARRDRLRMEDEELLIVIAATVERMYELAD